MSIIRSLSLKGRSHELGFSVLELLVVLMISTTGALFVLSEFELMMTRLRLHRRMHEVELLLKRIQLKGVWSGEVAILQCGGSGCRVSVGDGNLRELSIDNRTEGILMDSLDEPLRFYPSGVSRPVSIEFRESAVKCWIKISLRGRIVRKC